MRDLKSVSLGPVLLSVVVLGCAQAESVSARPASVGSETPDGAQGNETGGAGGSRQDGGAAGTKNEPSIDAAVSGNGGAGGAGQAGSSGEAGGAGAKDGGAGAKDGDASDGDASDGGGASGSSADGAGGSAGSTQAGGNGGQDGEIVDAGPPRVTYTNYCSRVHWTATASAAGTAGMASNAIDADPTSRWTTGLPQAGDEMLQIDLGGTATLSSVTLDNTASPTDYPRGYKVLLSTDGTTFPTTVATATPTAAASLTIPFNAQAARAVRIVQTGQTASWWSVDDVRFGCAIVPSPPEGAIDPYDPASWTAIASSNGGVYPLVNAFDGALDTRWATGSDQVGLEWFRLDLGAVTKVGHVVLDSGLTDFPATYTLELSIDGETFAQVASGAGATLPQIAFAQKDARYVRVNQTGTSTKWWSIYEISVRP